MVTRNPRTTVPDDWLRTADVARRFNVTVGTVFRWHSQGILGGVTSQNARLRFDPAKVEAFVRPAMRTPSKQWLGVPENMLSTSEAATVLQRSGAFVRVHAHKGEIPFQRTETGAMVYAPSDVNAYAAALAKREQDLVNLLSFNEAARRMGYTGAAWVTRMVQRGDVSVVLDDDGVRRIPVSEVERIIAARGGVNGKAWRRKATTAKGV
ncbi:hypothetical protein [Burkholderia anthina]|uniref:hypothetical protein n=1 Tax=Burkholderia anthina TaxID=179879 RepID=UPI0037C07F10